MRVVSIVGARPQFVKASVLSSELRKHHQEILLHTGQHYDRKMSDAFFDELAIPAPDVHLGAGSGTHAEQTGAMLVGIERTLAAERPDWVVIYGDTNSTLAGALAAAKLGQPVAHVEAGLRSFNWAMPEEINRVVADRLSTLLLCPSQVAVSNLEREGICDGVHIVGDLMAAALTHAVAVVSRRDDGVLETRFGVRKNGFALVTVHRAENTDDPCRLSAIVSALNRLQLPVVFPVHPRTRSRLSNLEYVSAPHVHLIPPIGYLDMIHLLSSCRVVLTDSGGLQKEAYWARVPCITLRNETEWVETIEADWNVLTGADADRIVEAVRTTRIPPHHPDLYGGSNAAAKCVRLMEAGVARVAANVPLA